MSALALWAPWNDRAGRLSWLKLATFVALVAPAVWMAIEWRFGFYSPRPTVDAVRESGDWALRILVASLAVTPLRYVTRWNRLILIRRPLGLAALFYTLGHIALWCVDLGFDWGMIVHELFSRLFLTIGLVGTLLLAALGVTSNDWGIRTLGARNWNRLHWWTYVATLLSVLHFFMETRLDVTQSTLLAGLFALAMAFRATRKYLSPDFAPLLGAAALCGVATAGIEAFYYGVSTRISPLRVLKANLDFSYSIRPAWWVFGVGVLIALLSFTRVLTNAPPPARKRVK